MKPTKLILIINCDSTNHHGLTSQEIGIFYTKEGLSNARRKCDDLYLSWTTKKLLEIEMDDPRLFKTQKTTEVTKVE